MNWFSSSFFFKSARIMEKRTKTSWKWTQKEPNGWCFFCKVFSQLELASNLPWILLPYKDLWNFRLIFASINTWLMTWNLLKGTYRTYLISNCISDHFWPKRPMTVEPSLDGLKSVEIIFCMLLVSYTVVINEWA